VEKQAALNPVHVQRDARADLKDCLLHQRPLKPVKPGAAHLDADEERAPLALPSQQRFRIYQEVNNLRILRHGLREEGLTLKQRDNLVRRWKKTASAVSRKSRSCWGAGGAVQFNLKTRSARNSRATRPALF
jgi:CRISPR-associated endonuclease Csn1